MSPLPRHRKLLYAIVVVSVPLLMLEGGARMLPDPVRPDLAAVAFSQADDGALYAPDPDLFWRLKPGLDVVFSGTKVRTGSSGFRGPEPKDPRILCVGDSVAFGYLVEEPEAWPFALARLTGVEVFDAGVPGYSSHQGRVLLDRLLKRYHPQSVVISFGYNDARLFPFADADAAQGNAARASFVLRRSALFRRLVGWRGETTQVREARELLAVRAADIAHFPPADAAQARDFLAGEGRIRKILERAPERVGLAAYRENLRAMVRAVREHGATPILLSPPYAAPSFEPYFAASRHRISVSRYRQEMHDLAREENATFVSIPVLNEAPEVAINGLFVTRPLAPNERDGWQRLQLSAQWRKGLGLSLDYRERTDLVHPSALGHGLMAETLADVIRRRNAS